MPEITTATTSVMANCLYIWPLIPPRNATGRNTAQRESTIATSALATWPMARSAATRGGTFSCAMIRSTFSITTIASSTTMPIASTRANSVSRLIWKPSIRSPKKVPMIATGTARAGIRVVRQLCRKMKTTRVTRTMASKSVFTTSLIEAVMNGVVSKGMNQDTPAGKLRASSFMRATTAVFTLSAFAPGRRYSLMAAVGMPFTRPTRS